MAVKDAALETARMDAELAGREAEQEELRLAAEHRAEGHPSYFSDCPECVADFDTPADPAIPVEQDDMTLPDVVPDTPYDQLVALLSAPTRCPHCGRTDPLTPAAVAEKVGLSETAVRRLAHADATPGLRAVKIMAEHLDMPAIRLLEVLWPALAQA